MKVRATIFVSALAVAVSPHDAAYAQQAVDAGQAGASHASESGRALDVNIWFGGAQTRRIRPLPSASREAVATLPPDNSETQFGVGALYARSHDRVSLTADLRSGFRVDSTTTRLWAIDHRATIGATFGLTRRMRLQTSQLVKVMPASPFVTAAQTTADDGSAIAVPPALDLRLPAGQAMTAINDTSLSYAVSRTSAVVLTNTLTYTVNGAAHALRGYATGAAFERRVSRYRTLRLGYRTEAATFDPSSRSFLQTHNIDASLVYQRQLPFARRTTISAGTGSSIARDTSRRVFRLQAHGSLVHRLTDSWNARVDFSRPVQIFEGLAAPIVTNSITASVGGRLGRRSDVSAMADYSAGTLGLTGSGNGLTSHTEAVRWQFALTRRVSVYADAFHGRSLFGAQLAPLPLRDVEHVGLRAFVSYAAPVFHD